MRLRVKSLRRSFFCTLNTFPQLPTSTLCSLQPIRALSMVMKGDRFALMWVLMKKRCLTSNEVNILIMLIHHQSQGLLLALIHSTQSLRGWLGGDWGSHVANWTIESLSERTRFGVVVSGVPLFDCHGWNFTSLRVTVVLVLLRTLVSFLFLAFVVKA